MIFLEMSDHVTGSGVHLITIWTRVSDALVNVPVMSPHCVPIKEGGLTNRTFSWLFGGSSGTSRDLRFSSLGCVVHKLQQIFLSTVSDALGHLVVILQDPHHRRHGFRHGWCRASTSFYLDLIALSQALVFPSLPGLAISQYLLYF